MKHIIHNATIGFIAVLWVFIMLYVPFKHAEKKRMAFESELVEIYLSQKIDGYVKGKRYYIDDKDPGYIAAASGGGDVFIKALSEKVFLHGCFMFVVAAAFAFFYKKSTYLTGFILFLPSLIFLAVFKQVIGVVFPLIGWFIGVYASRKLHEKNSLNAASFKRD